jgi:hypothetical protein
MQTPLPEELPALPHVHGQPPWSVNVLTAFRVLNTAYTHARGVLYQEGSDPLRYKLVSSNIVDKMLPILEHTEADGVSRDWIEECAKVFGPLVYELQVTSLAAEGMSVASVLKKIGYSPVSCQRAR